MNAARSDERDEQEARLPRPRVRRTICLIAAAFVALALAQAAPAATKTVYYGPFTVPGASGDVAGEVTKVRFGVAKPCGNCFVTSFTPNLVYASGTTASHETGAMLHHALFTSQFRPDATCSRTWLGLAGERFFASGDERTAIRLTDGYGYRLRSWDSWNLLVELMNMMPDARSVYLTVTFTYRPWWENVKPVKPVWLDIDQCSDSTYAITAGLSEATYDWQVTVPGKVITVAGHLHEYGRWLELTNASRGGQLICRSSATWDREDMDGPSGRITAMDLCVGNPLATIASGETLRLRSVYESPAARNDVMGIMLAYVHRT